MSRFPDVGKTAHSTSSCVSLGAGSLMVGNTLLLGDMPELQVSRIAAAIMSEAKHKDPKIELGVCGYEDATLVFYSDEHITRFDSVSELSAKVPFQTEGEAIDTHAGSYVIAVSDTVRDELDKRKIRYATLPRLPAMGDERANQPAFRISGFNTGNFKPVTITVITNLPQPAKTSTAPSTTSAPATGPETAR